MSNQSQPSFAQYPGLDPTKGTGIRGPELPPTASKTPFAQNPANSANYTDIEGQILPTAAVPTRKLATYSLPPRGGRLVAVTVVIFLPTSLQLTPPHFVGPAGSACSSQVSGTEQSQDNSFMTNSHLKSIIHYPPENCSSNLPKVSVVAAIQAILRL
jgi:hypothetical protein